MLHYKNFILINLLHLQICSEKGKKAGDRTKITFNVYENIMRLIGGRQLTVGVQVWFSMKCQHRQSVQSRTHLKNTFSIAFCLMSRVQQKSVSSSDFPCSDLQCYTSDLWCAAEHIIQLWHQCASREQGPMFSGLSLPRRAASVQERGQHVDVGQPVFKISMSLV